MRITDIISSGKLVYSSQNSDEHLRSIVLLQRACTISYYTYYELSQVDEVLLGILLHETNECINEQDLGAILGFDVIDSPLEGKYYDEAEKNLFTGHIESLLLWGLIRKVEDSICITELGRLAFTTKKKYRFYNLETNYYDFLNLNNEGCLECSNYPFYEEISCHINLSNSSEINYSDELTEYITNDISSDIINKVRLQIKDNIVLYSVKTREYISTKKVVLDAKLYLWEGEHYLIYYSNNKPCSKLFELFESEHNKDEKEKKIEWALLYQILNDPTAVLNYSNIGRFADILEIDKLIPDKRTQWSDPDLTRLIVSNCDGNDWYNLSRHCSCEVLKTLIDEHKDVLNWTELTIRMDEEFIISTSKIHPWNRDALFLRKPVESSLIKHFLLEHQFPEGLDDGLWNWDVVVPIVGIEFIREHIHDIPFNLYHLTEQLDKTDWDIIVENPTAKWNWHHISKQYELDYIYKHINTFYSYIMVESIFERVFKNEVSSSTFINNEEVVNAFTQRCKDGSVHFNVNNKKYIWSDDVISFFENLDLLTWPSGNYSIGFECNEHLKWDRDFFTKYYSKVSTAKGFNHISARISDTSLVSDFPQFAWDFYALSSNPHIYTNLAFIINYKDQVIPKIILQNAITYQKVATDELLNIFDIQTILNTEVALRSLLSQKASTEYIRSHIKYTWDWVILTHRLCPILKIETIGNETWANKWDWTYISSNRDIDDIISYAVKYNTLWDWHAVLKRLDANFLVKGNVLETLSKAFIDLENHNELCSLITQKFSTEELIDLTSLGAKRDIFDWDYSCLYSRNDFSAKEYLEKHIEDVKWDDFSESESVNKLFSKTGKEKTLTLWIQHYTEILNNPIYHWNFQKLTRLKNILSQPHLFELQKDWDWEYVSSNATWISFEKQKDYFLKKFIKKISFKALSNREDIGLTEKIVIKYEQKYEWDWEGLANNPQLCFSFDFINSHNDKPWNWALLSEREDLTHQIVEDNLDKPWNWALLTRQEWFVPSQKVMDIAVHHMDEESWQKLSNNDNITTEIIEQHRKFIDWNILVSKNKAFTQIASIQFLQQNEEFIPWDSFNQRYEDNITNEIVEAFYQHLDWHYVSKSQHIVFTTDFIDKYENLWHWSELFNNMKVREHIKNFEQIYKYRSGYVTFLNKLQRKRRNPKVYHFSHLFNAIDIIRSKRILSRDRALELGLLKFDSAGSVISRSLAAHKYARFYFRPCTPTQYYNEALGADSQLGEYNKRGEWRSKYPSAFNLGLPKCPVPVFFRFDLEEILSSMGPNCYYSDRNMQSDCPHIYPVREKPEMLVVEHLYSTMQGAFMKATAGGGYDRELHLYEMDLVKMYSQQEFLVEKEFDFSKLKNYEIICYDKHYAELLKSLIGDDSICDRITYISNEELFERENRSIDFISTDTYTMITSDFRDEHYYVVKSPNLKDIEFAIDSDSVISESPNEIKLRNKVKWSSTLLPLQVFFVDPNARTKEWLIYENAILNSNQCHISHHIISQLTPFLQFMQNVPIRLREELFYPNMISSYHGISHTARVTLYTYLLSQCIPGFSNSEVEACCIAAIIHDLGKTSDREGSVHGYNSRIRYQDSIMKLGIDETLKQRILDAIQYHSVEDFKCPDSVRNDYIFKVVKDADALDRSRFGGKGCDKSYLRLGIYNDTCGEAILKLAEILPTITGTCKWENPFDEMVEIITKMSTIWGVS